jgi:diguanylate cyclase (GGDEF)-like protein
MSDSSAKFRAEQVHMQHAPTDSISPRFLSYKYWQFGKTAVFAALTVHTAFIAIFLALQRPALVIFNIYSVATYVYCVYLQFRGNYRRASIVVFVEVVLHAIFATYILGWNAGFHLYILAIIPALFFDVSFDFRRKLLYGMAATIAYFALVIFADRLTPGAALGAGVAQVLWKMNMLGTLLMICYLGYRHAAITDKTQEELYLLATFDNLTGLFNRRRFNEITAYEIERGKRTGKPNSLILMDIDFFKQVNDRFGHDAGDHVLMEIAGLIKKNIRDLDVVARWGGEEFILLATETGRHEAIFVAERIRAAIEAHTFVFDGRKLHVTMTLGISQFEPDEAGGLCVKRADQALYEGKTGGRNRTVVQ